MDPRRRPEMNWAALNFKLQPILLLSESTKIAGTATVVHEAKHA